MRGRSGCGGRGAADAARADHDCLARRRGRRHRHRDVHADLPSDQQDDRMTTRSTLLTLIAGRGVASTLLLGSALLIQLSRPGAFPVDPFFFLIGSTYGLSVFYL